MLVSQSYGNFREAWTYILDEDKLQQALLNKLYLVAKKSLKIPKGQSESVHRRRTDNTMAKRKSTKGQTTIYKTYI